MHIAEDLTWEELLKEAVKRYLHLYAPDMESHTADTPNRVAAAWAGDVAGSVVDVEKILQKRFMHGNYNEMVHVRGVRVVSKCIHHFERIIGKAHFAYVPDKQVVGLSKIPRLIDALASRVQIQENLTEQIVNVFQKAVEPKGCAVSIRAYHMCMIARGVKETMSYTETTALRGVFADRPETRLEFLSSIDRSETIFP